MSDSLTFKAFKTTEASSVPASPGVYAWYATPTIGLFDWKKDINDDGEDLGQVRLREVLARHTDRFAPPPLACSSQVAFRDQWSGYLSATGYESKSQALLGKVVAENDPFPATAFDKVMSVAASRGILSRLILESSPIFHSPVYVGKSKNLKARISTHVAELNKLHKAIVDDPDLLERLRLRVSAPADSTHKKKITFAVRAIAAGFVPDHLEVRILDIGSFATVDLNTSSHMAEALEWLLNTWQRPLLGRE
jgi:hypothetical protein